MGNHYVPQYYLKGFTLDGKNLWVFDKKERRIFQTQVKNIANENDFYSPYMESYLDNNVEKPANRVLKAIRDRIPVLLKDKEALSAYMVCMIKRVPRGLELFNERLPSVAEKIGDSFDKKLKEASGHRPERAEFFEQRRAELQKIIKRCSSNPPKNIWEDILPPRKSPMSLEALSRMTWRFLTHDKCPAFLTSDNPVFFFSHLGIGNAISEVTFPISSNIALWATWRDDLEEGYYPAPQSWIKELNRRMASITTRYAFYAINESWILSILTKNDWKLRYLT